LVLANDAAVKTHKASPMARIVAYGFGGVPPRIMGMGPVPASKMATATQKLAMASSFQPVPKFWAILSLGKVPRSALVP